MKRLLVVLASVFLALAARADNVTVHVRESVTIDIDGATAAYAIDPSIVDVAMAGAGRVALTGRSAGTTQLIVVTAAGTKPFLVTIGAARAANVPRAVAANEAMGRLESRYASDTSRLQNSFDIFMRDGERRSQFHLLNVRYLGQRYGSSSTAFPSMFYRVNTPHRELTFGDDYVDASPLTVRGTQVRGFHLRDDRLEIHAGYAASTMWEDLFLPADRRWVGGVGYGIDRGGIRWTPSIYGFLSEPKQTTARKGVVGALAAEYRRADALWIRGEVGVSRVVAASRSEPNWAKAAISRYWLSSPLIGPATCFIALIWALPPTRDTEMPTFTAGRMPWKNKLVSRKICPSVIEITLVGI